MDDDPWHDRPVTDVPRGLRRHGELGSDDGRWSCRLHDRGVWREFATEGQLVLALVGGCTDGHRHSGGFRYVSRRTLGTHGRHLHDHDYARAGDVFLLFDSAKLADL